MTTARSDEATSAPSAVLAGRGPSFHYPDAPPVSTALDVEKGEVSGPTEAGRRLCCGCCRAAPGRGEDYLSDERVRRGRRALAELRRRGQRVFQGPDHQLFPVGVTQDVSFGPLPLGPDTRAARKRVGWAPDALEIAHPVEQPTHLPSHGPRPAPRGPAGPPTPPVRPP